jgi:hypothetical protein
MARSERQVPNVYFGRPGKLLTLPWPRGDMDRTYERQTFDFVTGSGLHQVSSLSSGSRSYTLNWNALSLDSFSKLGQYRIGANGPGPWVLIDPSTPNLLPPNIGAASGLYANNTQMVVGTATNGVPGSNALPAFIHRTEGYRSMSWTFSTGPIVTTPTFEITPMYRSWFGQPVMPGLPYSFSSWLTVDGVIETSATVAIQLIWLDAAGATLSTSNGGNTTVAAWTKLTVTGTAPVGAVYVKPVYAALGSSLAVNGVIYIDEPLLEQDSVVNTWAPSTGIRPVEIVDLREVVPFEARFRTAVTMTLRELAR